MIGKRSQTSLDVFPCVWVSYVMDFCDVFLF